MRVKPIPHGLNLMASDLVRSQGLHMSDIYGKLYEGLEPKRYGKKGEFPTELIALGSAWENHIEFLIKKAGLEVIRPGELFTPEGIAYSPDGIIADDYRLAEYKFSSMDTKDLPTEPTNSFPSKFGKYMCQMKLYCYQLETNLGRLYFMSNYRPHQPKLLAFDIEFSARELHEEWTIAMNFARQRKML